MTYASSRLRKQAGCAPPPRDPPAQAGRARTVPATDPDRPRATPSEESTMNEPYRVEPLTADFQPPLAPLIDRAFDAWDGDVAALLGVPRGTFEPETEAVEPTEF
ncbi:hypothetical protein ME121_0215 [Methylobacterium sp. ME121]|nr:hypothetical protein ME121_0215 [Methylobacterium sp. ME121]